MSMNLSVCGTFANKKITGDELTIIIYSDVFIKNKRTSGNQVKTSG